MVRVSLALALALTWAASVRAQPNEEAVRFQYAAPAECPDAASFTAQVRERTPRGRLADSGELARTFSIEIAADAPGFLGSIQFLDDGGTKVSRRLHGEQCDAVVSSLALITALALDATLRQDEEAASPPPSSSQPEQPSSAVVVSVPAPPPRRAAPTRSLSGARVGVAVGYDSALPAVPIGLLGQLDWRAGFALRLSAHYAWRDFVVDKGRSARLKVLGVETSVCPWRWRLDELRLAPCAAVDLGSLRAAGVQSAKLPSAWGKTIAWLSAGVELRLAWEPAVPFWVELSGGLAFPLVAHRFTFVEPDADVYEVPRVSGSAGVTSGVRF